MLLLQAKKSNTTHAHQPSTQAVLLETQPALIRLRRERNEKAILETNSLPYWNLHKADTFYQASGPEIKSLYLPP